MPPLINVKIVTDTTGLKKGLDESGAAVNDFGNIVNGLKVGGQIAAVTTVIAGLASATFDTVRAGQDSLAAQEKFAKAIENAGAATDGYQAKVDAAIEKGAGLAFTDDEIRDSLATLTFATKDINSSLSYLSAAQDVARSSGVDLGTASDAVAKAIAGQDSTLARLIPGIEKGGSAGETMGKAFAFAAGQADIFATSGEAAGIKTGIGFSELQETIGEQLVPAFQELMEAVQPLIDAFIELIKVLLPAIMPLIRAVAGVIATMARIIKTAIDFAVDLFRKLQELIKPLQDLYDKLASLNPFGDILGQIGGIINFSAPPSGPSATPFGAKSSGSANNQGPVTINIYGDPSVIEARVTKALRDYSRRNGIESIFTANRV